MAFSLTGFLKKQRTNSQDKAHFLNFFNGVTGEATVRQTEVKNRPQMSTLKLAAAATTSTALMGGLAVGLAADEGTLASYCTTVTSFVGDNLLIPDTLAGNIGTAAGLAFTACALTAGLIDFADRIRKTEAKTFFQYEDLSDLLVKTLTTITSATGLPSVFLLLKHALLLLASVGNALGHTFVCSKGKSEAWTEVSENSRALCFQLVALALIPVGNVIDLLGTAAVGTKKSVNGFFASSTETPAQTPAQAITIGTV